MKKHLVGGCRLGVDHGGKFREFGLIQELEKFYFSKVGGVARHYYLCLLINSRQH
jgi:hypothetical protein